MILYIFKYIIKDLVGMSKLFELFGKFNWGIFLLFSNFGVFGLWKNNNFFFFVEFCVL